MPGPVSRKTPFNSSLANVTAEEKALLEKMNNSPNFKPNPDKNERSFFDKVREMFG